MKNVVQFLDGVKREFAKVAWPSRAELTGSTLVVLAVMSAFSVYLGVIDFLLGRAAGFVLSL